MTDLFHYNNTDYILLAFDNINLMAHGTFDIRSYLEIEGGRSFATTYGIDRKHRLIVKNLRLRGKLTQALGQIQPIHDDKSNFETIYKNINYPIIYTGYLLFVNEPAFLAPQAYFKDEEFLAYELEIVNGKVMVILDWSQKMEEKRDEISASTLPQADDFTFPEDYFQKDWKIQFFPHRYRYIYWGGGNFTDYEYITKIKKKR